MPSGERATAGRFSRPANCWPGGNVIVKRLTGGGGGEGFRFQIAIPVAAARSKDTAPHSKAPRQRARRLFAAPVGANVICEPPSALHFNSSARSRAVCQRSSGSFARQRRIA